MKKLLTLLLLTIGHISIAQVTISGTAKNYTDSVFYIREPGGFDNYTRAWRDKMIKVEIDKNGYFETKIPEQAINTWYIKTEKGNQFFDLIHGQDIKLVADFSQPNPLKGISKNAGDFNYSSSSYLTDSVSKYYKDKQFSTKIRNKSIDSVLFYRKGLANYKLKLLEKYNEFHPISKRYYDWLVSKYTYEPYERLLVENINNKDSVDESTFEKLIQRGVNDEYSALNNSDYNDIVDFYVRTKFGKQNKEEFSADKYFNFVANGNLIKGNTKAVWLSRFMYWMRTAPDSSYVPIFEKYNRLVSNNAMKQLVVNARADYSNSTVAVKQDFTRAKSLEEIFKKYKGKVIYVDFWASWCVPCREEMPNSEALKKKLKGKDIVFLYFGYNDKEKAWLKARDQLNIEGEHYLLTESLIKQADEVFGINGIPHYAIIDKEGNIVTKRADRPNDIYRQLLKQIEKQN